MKANEPVKKARWTATELRKLPIHERDAILEQAAILAEHEYRTNVELTAFEAFDNNELTTT